MSLTFRSRKRPAGSSTPRRLCLGRFEAADAAGRCAPRRTGVARIHPPGPRGPLPVAPDGGVRVTRDIRANRGRRYESGDRSSPDSQTPSTQQWLRTHTYQELFAPDGLALTRQLAAASLMRFTFTPFNSRPVVAEFNVKGFDEHVAMVAGTCGWATPERTNARKR